MFDKSAPTVIAGQFDIPKTLLTPYHLVVSLYRGDRDASWALTEVDEDDFLQRHTEVDCFGVGGESSSDGKASDDTDADADYVSE